MAKYYTETHSHPFSWQQVAEAIFQRYPNPFSTHVLSEDTVHRAVVGAGGNVLYTRRFLTKTNKLPSWGEKYLSRFKKMVPLVEESTVDREKRIITTYTRNVGLSMFMSAIEKVSYRQHPNDPNVTIAVKEAWIESGLYGLRLVHMYNVIEPIEPRFVHVGVTRPTTYVVHFQVRRQKLWRREVQAKLPASDGWLQPRAVQVALPAAAFE